MSELSPQAEGSGAELALLNEGAPAKPFFRLCGERRGSETSELSPQAEGSDVELAPTTS